MPYSSPIPLKRIPADPAQRRLIRYPDNVASGGYQKKRRRGLHHLSAVTATAIKVTRAVWRVCIDQRDYLRAGRPERRS